jgi:hypothetical protein
MIFVPLLLLVTWNFYCCVILNFCVHENLEYAAWNMGVMTCVYLYLTLLYRSSQSSLYWARSALLLSPFQDFQH